MSIFSRSRKIFLVILLLFGVIIGCRDSTENVLTIGEVHGIIASDKDFSKLSLITPVGEYSISPNGEFRAEVFNKIPQFLYATDADENIVFIYHYAPSKGKEIVIDKESLAYSTVLQVPLPWSKLVSSSDWKDIYQFISSTPSFARLKEVCEEYLQDESLFDIYSSDVFPIVAQVINDMYSFQKKKELKTLDKGISLNCKDGEIVATNYKAIPYGFSGYNINTTANGCTSEKFLFDHPPVWVESAGLLKVIFGPTERQITLDARSYYLNLAKPNPLGLEELFTLVAPSTGVVLYWKEVREAIVQMLSSNCDNAKDAVFYDARLRAWIGFEYEIILKVIGIIPGIGDAIQIGGDLLEPAISGKNWEELLNLGLYIEEGANYSFPEILKGIGEALYNKKDKSIAKAAAKIIFKDARRYRIIRLAGKNLAKLAEITDVIEVVVSLYDLVAAPDKINGEFMIPCKSASNCYELTSLDDWTCIASNCNIDIDNESNSPEICFDTGFIAHNDWNNVSTRNFELELDFKIYDARVGDFNIIFGADWPLENDCCGSGLCCHWPQGTKGSINIYPPGSDSSPDSITFNGQTLYTKDSIASAGDWHHLKLTLMDNSIQVFIDGHLHMSTNLTEELRGAMALRFWYQGCIKNICAK